MLVGIMKNGKPARASRFAYLLPVYGVAGTVGNLINRFRISKANKSKPPKNNDSENLRTRFTRRTDTQCP